MEYQLKLLKIFNKNGFTKIVDLLDEFLSDEDNLLNFIILNINNMNNIKYLCNFFKKDITKYIDLINKIIINKNVTTLNKEFLLLNILNTYHKDNIKLINETTINVIYENLKYNNDMLKLDVSDNINSIILYKILNSSIFEIESFNTIIYDEIYTYYNYIFDKINLLNKDLILDFIFNISNIYNYRCKTYSTTNLIDNIIFIFLYYVNNKYNDTLLQNYNTINDTNDANNTNNTNNTSNDINNINDTINIHNSAVIHFITKNIDINNINYEDIKSYEINFIYEILFIKLIHITIPYSINEIEHNNSIILDYETILYKISSNNLLETFSTLQNYISINNEKKIKKYRNYNIILYNKLSNKLLNHISDYYVKLVLKLYKNLEKIENNELFTNIVINLIDFYIFYNKNYTYVYKDLEEKLSCLHFFIDLFISKSSNINLDIKIVDFFNFILYKNNEISETIVDKINLNNILNKSFLFYTKLDTYEDYYRNTIKYKVITIYNNLFYIRKYNKDLLNFSEASNISKFLISFNEDININISNFILYYSLYLTNRDYGTLASSHYIYLEEFLRFYKFIIINYFDNIETCIIEINIHKFNKNIINLNKYCTKKNNVYKLMLYMIDIYLLLDNHTVLQYIKNDIYNFDYNNFISICNNLYTIHKHKNISLFKELVEKVNNLEIVEDKEYDNIPDEFLDPLCNILINIPVELPSSKQCVDLDIIKKHLLYHSFDPFNREELTLEKLENYNKQPEVEKKMSILLSKIKKWKETN